MSDRRKDIPIGCALNVAIISEISNTDTFKDACINVPLKYGIKPPNDGNAWPFFNSSWGGYMMYSQFVVSKELYNLPKEDDFFRDLIDKNAMKDFQIHKERHSFNDDPKYHFASFRNATSHVNYDINDQKVELWDHPPEKPDKADWHWHVEIENTSFMKFLGLVNEANFKLYNQINSRERNPDGTKK